MLQLFVIGFASGCLVGFVSDWFWTIRSRKKDRTNKTSQEIPYRFAANEKVYKLALVVNKELKMGDGKIMAQCAHAAVGTYESYYVSRKSIFEAWERQGKHVYVFKVSDTETLLALYQSVKARSVISCLVRDAGRTQIASGSKTVLAIGPEEESVLNGITEYLLPYS